MNPAYNAENAILGSSASLTNVVTARLKTSGSCAPEGKDLAT